MNGKENRKKKIKRCYRDQEILRKKRKSKEKGKIKNIEREKINENENN